MESLRAILQAVLADPTNPPIKLVREAGLEYLAMPPRLGSQVLLEWDSPPLYLEFLESSEGYCLPEGRGVLADAVDGDDFGWTAQLGNEALIWRDVEDIFHIVAGECWFERQPCSFRAGFRQFRDWLAEEMAGDADPAIDQASRANRAFRCGEDAFG